MFNFWELPSGTFSIKDQKVVAGVEGAKISLTQAADELRTIASLYPNGKIQTEYMGLQDPRFHYYGEMDDRFHHGMSNTISAFVGGWDDAKVGHDPVKGNSYDWIQSQNGPDQFLTRSWPSYDLAKFIIGYGRGNPKVPENEGIELITPSVLRMAGFPTNLIVINPIPTGASPDEYAVGLPQNIAHILQASFPNILLGPGYTVSIYSCGDGLKKDGIKDALVLYGDTSVYLMKDG